MFYPDLSPLINSYIHSRAIRIPPSRGSGIVVKGRRGLTVVETRRRELIHFRPLFLSHTLSILLVIRSGIFPLYGMVPRVLAERAVYLPFLIENRALSTQIVIAEKSRPVSSIQFTLLVWNNFLMNDTVKLYVRRSQIFGMLSQFVPICT